MFLHPCCYFSVLKPQWEHVLHDSIALNFWYLFMAPWDLPKLPLHYNTQNHAREENSTQKSLLQVVKTASGRTSEKASLSSSREFSVCANRVLTNVGFLPIYLVLSVIPLVVFSHCLLCEESLGHWHLFQISFHVFLIQNSLIQTHWSEWKDCQWPSKQVHKGPDD